tara:strand:- start:24291 stop:24902 length:612 start_codon:yes stop_codon:yes gene_type:complete
MSHRIHIVENFISYEDAQTLIREQNSPSSTNPYPEHYTNRVGGSALPYNNTVIDILRRYSIKASNEMKQAYGFVNPIYTYKAFGSVWVTGQSGDLHGDGGDKEPFVEFSTVIYLNESPDFEGGKIFFPNQDFDYEPKALSAVMFPSCGLEHVHGITEITGGLRRTACFMHTSLPGYADPDLQEDGYESDSDWRAEINRWEDRK